MEGFCIFGFWDRILHSPGWPWIVYRGKMTLNSRPSFLYLLSTRVTSVYYQIQFWFSDQKKKMCECSIWVWCRYKWSWWGACTCAQAWRPENIVCSSIALCLIPLKKGLSLKESSHFPARLAASKPYPSPCSAPNNTGVTVAHKIMPSLLGCENPS